MTLSLTEPDIQEAIHALEIEDEISYSPAFSKRIKELSDKIYRDCLS